MKMEKIKFKNGTSLELYNISSTGASLTFSVLDEAKKGLEEICKQEENTEVIKYISVNDSGDETTLKGYAGYTNLTSIKTEYGIVTNIDYESTDDTTESGFTEEIHDVTTVVLNKPSKVESDIADIQESQKLQDGAIEELAEVVSGMAESEVTE